MPVYWVVVANAEGELFLLQSREPNYLARYPFSPLFNYTPDPTYLVGALITVNALPPDFTMNQWLKVS